MKLSDVILQNGRALEWLTSAVLLSFSMILLLPGNSFGPSSAWIGFVEFGLNEVSVAVPVMLLAILRMSALLINGMWRKSPVLRMVGAAFGAFCFGLITSIVAYPYFEGTTSVISTGIGVYSLLAVADIIAAYRAGADVGNYTRTY